jgi:hypothetical protein
MKFITLSFQATWWLSWYRTLSFQVTWWLSRYRTLSFQVTWWLSRYSSFRGGWHTTVWTDSLGTTLTPVPSTLGAVSLEINEPAARIEPLSAPTRKRRFTFSLYLHCSVRFNRTGSIVELATASRGSGWNKSTSWDRQSVSDLAYTLQTPKHATLVHEIWWNNSHWIQDSEMYVAWSAHGRVEKRINILVRKPEGKRPLGRPRRRFIHRRL